MRWKLVSASTGWRAQLGENRSLAVARGTGVAPQSILNLLFKKSVLRGDVSGKIGNYFLLSVTKKSESLFIDPVELLAQKITFPSFLYCVND